MSIPYNIPSREMLLAMVNEDNNINIPFSAITFGLPSLRFGNYNTTVVMSPRAESNLIGNRALNYNRLDIEIYLGSNPIVYSNDIHTAYDVALAINAQYNLGIQEDDIVNEAVHGSIHILRMHENSFAWYGDVLVHIQASNRPLNTVITNSQLFGLAYPT